MESFYFLQRSWAAHCTEYHQTNSRLRWLIPGEKHRTGFTVRRIFADLAFNKLRAKRSALGDALQVIEKSGIRNAGTIRIADYRFTFGGKTGNRERHGDAMVAVRLDFRTMHRPSASALNVQTVGTLLDGGAHAAQIFCQRGNAVALFDPQLRGVANLDSLFREWPQGCEHRQLINDQRDLRAF